MAAHAHARWWDGVVQDVLTEETRRVLYDAAILRGAEVMRNQSSLLLLGAVLLTAACSSSGPDQSSSSDDALNAAPRGAKELVFDFTADHSPQGFKGLFRDIPQAQHDEFVRRQATGGDLGPVPPETEKQLSTPPEHSHWFMNAGVYEVADNPGVFGFLLQGVNRSDDMDKYMVREFGVADGLSANTAYEVVVDDFGLASNDGLGQMGPGGGVARQIEVALVNRDPYPYIVDFNKHVRFTNENRPAMDPATYDSLGSTGVCITAGSFRPVPGVPQCPRSGRIPFAVSTKGQPTRTLSITTNDKGSFWMLIGGHSGHEGLDDLYVTKLKVSVTR